MQLVHFPDLGLICSRWISETIPSSFPTENYIALKFEVGFLLEGILFISRKIYKKQFNYMIYLFTKDFILDATLSLCFSLSWNSCISWPNSLTETETCWIFLPALMFSSTLFGTLFSFIQLFLPSDYIT